VPYGWITETPRAAELRLLAKNTIGDMEPEEMGILLILPLFTWQDDFDPNNSTKNNRGSVWTQTLTIAPPQTQQEFIIPDISIGTG
jgi:hypothetical protein